MFDEENLISLAIFLSFCLSVHNTYVQPWLWGYVFFATFLSFLPKCLKFIIMRPDKFDLLASKTKTVGSRYSNVA